MDRFSVNTRTADQVGTALGTGFSQYMVSRINERLSVDVLVIDLKGDAYTMKVAGRYVIVTKRTPVWFRQNFSLAHELGHIAFDTFHSPVASDASTEGKANAFAAELLMPESQLRTLEWATMSMTEFAQYVWDFGVSTKALVNRLSTLRLPLSKNIEDARNQNTFSLLRRYWAPEATHMDQTDPITVRRERSAQRSIPSGLTSRLETAVLAGKAPKQSLAFLLDVSVDDLDLGADDSDDSGDSDDVFLLGSILS